MCGICGQYNYRDGAPVEVEVIDRMVSTIVHRGPDDAGTFISGSLGLGFRRLAIIDPSAAGHQPMSDRERTVWVVFNGEIYNFRELRAELTAHGHSFRTNCDTEVIVLGFKEWGDGVLSRLKGMYGLAIWDNLRRRLIVARDPMGIKPVYYRLEDGTLWFGSEIRPILAAHEPAPTIDVAAVNSFLKYRYTPANATIYEGIKKLAAGEAIEVSAGSVRKFQHYRFQPRLADPQPTKDEAKERLLHLYRVAIKRHLISDVPVGLFLSGGLDSGLLLGLMNECGANWPTFTVGYGRTYRDDELDDAAETARWYGAKHTSVRLDQAEFERALPHIVDVLEEPIASSSIVPMYFVAQRARQDVKVALIGQGPDELLGGYRRHIGVRYASIWRNSPAFVRGVVTEIAKRMPRNETLKRGVYALAEPDRVSRLQRVFSLLPEAQIDALFRPDLRPELEKADVAYWWSEILGAPGRLDDLGELQLIELRSSLPDELLMFADKMSMAHSLEARVPYLDQDVVEYVQTLNGEFKVRHGERKWLHRQVCRDFLPRAILRRKKRGFGVNIVDDWLRRSTEGKLANYLGDPQSRIYTFVNFAEVNRLAHEHTSGRSDHHKVLFSLVLLETWLRSERRESGIASTALAR